MTARRFHAILQVVYAGGIRSGLIVRSFDTFREAQEWARVQAVGMLESIGRGDKWWSFPMDAPYACGGGILLDAVVEWYFETDPATDPG